MRHLVFNFCIKSNVISSPYRSSNESSEPADHQQVHPEQEEGPINLEIPKITPPSTGKAIF